MRRKDLRERLRRIAPDVLSRLEGDEAPCPPAEVLRAFVERRLAEEQSKQVAFHLLSCGDCARSVSGWDAVERDDARRDESFWQRTLARRPRLALAAVTAAAAALLLVILPPMLARKEFTAELVSATGALRGAVLRRDQAVELRLSLPAPACAYVYALEGGEAELLFPAEGEGGLLQGDAVLPGGGEAWQLAGVEPGAHALLVGIAPEPLSEEEKAAALAALRSLGGELRIDAARKAASPHFRAVKVLPFTVAE